MRGQRVGYRGPCWDPLHPMARGSPEDCQKSQGRDFFPTKRHSLPGRGVVPTAIESQAYGWLPGSGSGLTSPSDLRNTSRARTSPPKSSSAAFLESTVTAMDGLEDRLSQCLDALRAGDDSAREKILEICDARLRELSSRLLGKFAKVRRWDNTDDVAQNAAMRLYRALKDVVPDSPRGLMGLMATQIQRELIDLARKHAGDTSYAANHGTNVQDGSQGNFYVDQAPDGGEELDEEIPIDRWEAFHEAVESLPDELRETFKLVWYLGVDREAAAEALGISLRTFARRWQEARAAVKRRLNSES